MGIGARIRQARLVAMKAVGHMAKICEVDLATWNGWENESIPFPRENLFRVAQELNVSLAWLERDEGPMEVTDEMMLKSAFQSTGLLAGTTTKGGDSAPAAPVVDSRKPEADAKLKVGRAQQADLRAQGEGIGPRTPNELRKTLLQAVATCAAILAKDSSHAQARKTMKEILTALESVDALVVAMDAIDELQ